MPPALVQVQHRSPATPNKFYPALLTYIHSHNEKSILVTIMLTTLLLFTHPSLKASNSLPTFTALAKITSTLTSLLPHQELSLSPFHSTTLASITQVFQTSTFVLSFTLGGNTLEIAVKVLRYFPSKLFIIHLL